MKRTLSPYDKQQRRRVYSIVRWAIRTGRLIRQPCVICDARGHAHHESYEHPLDVTWLCPKHHAAWHVEKRIQRAGEEILSEQRQYKVWVEPYITHVEYDPEYLHAMES